MPRVNLSNIFARKDPFRSCLCSFAGEFSRETPDFCHPEAFPAVASPRQVTMWKFKLNISYSMIRAASTALTEGDDVFHTSKVCFFVFIPIHNINLYGYNSIVADAAARLRPKYDEILKLSVTSVETAWKYTNLSDQIGAVCFDPSANFVCVAGIFSQIRSARTGSLHCWTRALPGAPSLLPSVALELRYIDTISETAVQKAMSATWADGTASRSCIVSRMHIQTFVTASADRCVILFSFFHFYISTRCETTVSQANHCNYCRQFWLHLCARP